jgi:hypothetical protein
MIWAEPLTIAGALITLVALIEIGAVRLRWQAVALAVLGVAALVAGRVLL